MFSDAFQWHIPTPATGSWVTVIVDLLRPLSQNGQVKLNSSDPLVQPNVNLNFFYHDLDIVALRQGIRFVDDMLMNGDGFKDIIGEGGFSPTVSFPFMLILTRIDYPWPMPRNSDEAMNKMVTLPNRFPCVNIPPPLRSITNKYTTDPCGTTRLSKNIEEGVVDNQLKVHGVKNLRVIDASVFPVIPDCRIQNAVYMVAEQVRISDLSHRDSLLTILQGADIIKAAYPKLY